MPTRSVTSGFPILDTTTPERADVPAIEVTAGIVVISGGGEREFIRGDSNGDGSLNVSDPTHTLGILFGGDSETLSCEDAADANDDGGLNITDAVYALSHLFGGGAPPPAPFPEAGIDPTEDELECRAAE